EGVEDAETARRFADLDCDYLQGYFFSRPLPESEFIEVIKKQEINQF
ncbi:MAG: EAL domain-containing protein, partial [Spirochaetaceae bacterium]|nr:EAL domain-containing protein [Spirochaetaceae bacterium]